MNKYTTLARVGRNAVAPILIDPGAVARISEFIPPGTTRGVLVSDATVMALHGGRVAALLQCAGLEVIRVSFPAGEASKNRRTLAVAQDRALAAGVDRLSVVVGLGGGVTTDIAGLLAATLLRGLTLLNVPTTVVGAVDAAVGGKNGVDTRRGKNLIGTFHWPEAVLVDTDLLATLPRVEVLAGMAEVVKHGVIADPGLLDQVEMEAKVLARGAIPGQALLERAARVKQRVVEDDPFEHGRRRILNFGHTVGHAIEAAMGYRFGHGPAVAAGMAVEARIAGHVTSLPAGDAARIARMVGSLGLPADPPCEFARARRFLLADKKTAAGTVRMALPIAVGAMEEAGGDFVVPVPPDLIEECWRAV